MNKVVINCSTKETEIVELTTEEITALEHDAQQNPPLPQTPSTEERLMALEDAMLLNLGL